MTTKDIRYQGHTNLENCESEPIHIPGSIQPHGFLLGVSLADYTVTYCSANTEDFIGLAPARILAQSLSSIVGEAVFADILALYANQSTDRSQRVEYGGTPYNLTLHRSGETLILELELFPDGLLDTPDLYLQTRRFVNFMESAGSLQMLSQHVAEEVRKITGYDRVMVYRFDEHYNGEVFAESKNADLEPFLNLHYPHTDIPPQARQLYLLNLMRLIGDVRYTPVPILTTEQTADYQSLDLSLSVLRSVSPIHIEYLQNMGVEATMSISLLHNKKLWGLLACHHYSPKLLPHYTRLFAKLQAHFLASQIEVRQSADEYEYSIKINTILDDLLIRISDRDLVEAKLQQDEAILQVVNATGFIIMNRNTIFSVGKVPDTEQLHKLVQWLDINVKTEFFYTSKLSDHYVGAEPIHETATGIFYHSFTEASRQCIIWFRGEVEETILWAGKPEKNADPAKQLSPRKSFETWKELLKLQSPRWIKSEISAAMRLATNIQHQFRLRDLMSEEEKYRRLSAHLQEINEELSHFSYVCSHDLQEPLRKIRVFTELLHQNIHDPAAVESYFRKIDGSAERMSTLINDLLNYTRIAKTDVSFEPIDLNDILEKVKVDFELLIPQKGAVVTSTSLPVIPAIPFQISQLFYNLISNALKFADQAPIIHISCHLLSAQETAQIPQLDLDHNYVLLNFTDNGIGFEQKFAQHIFDIFKRLHGKHEFSGTGIGLALCKKIVDNHHGWITAQSELGKGATFQVYLPTRQE